MKTGQIIKELRAKSGLTQEALAEKLFVSRELVSKWEADTRRPDYKTVIAICELFGVDKTTLTSPSDDAMEELSGCIAAETNITATEFSNLLNGFLLTVSAQERIIFIARYYYFETASEIAAEFKMNASTVRSVLMRTRNKLSDYIKEAFKNE